MQAQVALYAEFGKRLDAARYAGLFGGKDGAEKARANCHQLIQLYDDIERHQGPGAVGLPPLSPQQQEQFREDAFEVFVLAAWVENNTASQSSPGAKKEAAQQAIHWLNRAEKLLPPTRVLFAHRSGYWGDLGDVEASQADSKRALAVAPTSAVDHFWHGVADRLRANSAQAKGDLKGMQDYYRKAIGEYAALLQQRPEHFWAYLDWASCQFQLRNYDDAIVGYTACIHLKPDAPWPYHNRGSSHWQLGQRELAIEDYTRALKWDDRAIDTYTSRAQAHLAIGAKERAFEDFGHAISLSPDLASSYSQRGDAYRQLNQYAEALRDYDKALTLDPKWSDAYVGRGMLVLAQKQPEVALTYFDRAVEANPKNQAAFLQRAQTHRLLKRYPKARDDYDQALSLNPTDTQTYLLRAQLFQEMKLPDEAMRDYDRIVALRPTMPRLTSLARGSISVGVTSLRSAIITPPPSALRIMI